LSKGYNSQSHTTLTSVGTGPVVNVLDSIAGPGVDDFVDLCDIKDPSERVTHTLGDDGSVDEPICEHEV
jgi:hypothetical protein